MSTNKDIFSRPAFAGLGSIDSNGNVIDQEGVSQLLYVAAHLKVADGDISAQLASALTGKSRPMEPGSVLSRNVPPEILLSDLEFWAEAEAKYRVKLARALIEECAK